MKTPVKEAESSSFFDFFPKFWQSSDPSPSPASQAARPIGPRRPPPPSRRVPTVTQLEQAPPPADYPAGLAAPLLLKVGILTSLSLKLKPSLLPGWQFELPTSGNPIETAHKRSASEHSKDRQPNLHRGRRPLRSSPRLQASKASQPTPPRTSSSSSKTIIAKTSWSETIWNRTKASSQESSTWSRAASYDQPTSNWAATGEIKQQKKGFRSSYYTPL